jgi:hypothetical protein
MKSEPLDALPLWAFFLSVCVIVWAALELGYRLGQWRHARAADEKDVPVGAIVATIFALLAFMLAFTFGMAASRFEERRQAVLHEANAIGTTYLRTRLLPEPQRSEIAALLREYVDVRLSGAGKGGDKQVIDRADSRSEELQGQMWSKAMAVAEKNPTVMTGLFVQSLNETIDVHATNILVGVRSRVPLVIWIGLLGIAVLGMGSNGYHAGLSGTRRSPAMMALVLAFAGVLLLIADLDRPWEGALSTSQEALVDLQRSMKTPPP